jgi:hypothetical protein
MWGFLKSQWQQIRGDAKWWLIQTKWGVAVGGLTATWGWIILLPGPAIFCLALAAAAFSISIINGIQERQLRKKREQNKFTSPDNPALPTPPTQSFAEIATLTAGLIIQLKEVPEHIPIKIVSTPGYMQVTKSLVKIFRAADYQFVIDQQGGEEIFPADKEHGEFVLRYRKDNDKNILHPVYCGWIARILDPWLRSPRIEPFPKESTIPYFQIELGGAPALLPNPTVPSHILFPSKEEPFRNFLRRLFPWLTR